MPSSATLVEIKILQSPQAKAFKASTFLPPPTTLQTF